MYAQMMVNPDNMKDRFYDNLHILIRRTPSKDKMIIPDDFNACIGNDYQT